jgi:cobalt-zinc-cadmium efflux system membrane fusion protein
MNASTSNPMRVMRQIAIAAVVLGAGGIGTYYARAMSKSSDGPGAGAAKASQPGAATTAEEAKVERIGSDGLLVPASIVTKMGLQVESACLPKRAVCLPPFQGVLALDNDRLSRVHSRFAGEVVEIGTTTGTAAAPGIVAAEGADGSPSPAALRPLQVGDRVSRGDLLAVVWSKDLGEKKSEFVDALAKLRAEEQILVRMKKLADVGAGAERAVRDSERNVQAARVDASKAERTLRTWRLTEADIAEIRSEAARLIALDNRAQEPTDWARVEIRAAIDGVILEKNITTGDLVETTSDLFKIGDVSHLVVWAHLYEEDLPLLEKMPRPVPWTVALAARPDMQFSGRLDKISSVIDPAQHTALVSGRVENPSGDLKVGQFVTVTVQMPPCQDELELASSAVVEDGHESVVFLQGDGGTTKYVRRPVAVVRRLRDAIYVRVAQNGGGVRPGDRIVTTGALMLQNAMNELAIPPDSARDAVVLTSATAPAESSGSPVSRK